MPWTSNSKVIKLREESAAFDVFVRTLDGWRQHLSSRNASVLSLFGFLTIFPLLLVATTILGFVLEGNKELQKNILEGSLDAVPVLGERLANDPTALTGSVSALVIGLVAALWSSTKAFVGMQHALDDIWEIDVDDRAGFGLQRARALGGIVIIGIASIASTATVAVVNNANLHGLSILLLTLATAVINIVAIAAMYRFLTSAKPSWRDVAPGALGAGVVVTMLQHFGTAIVQKISEDAGQTYGNFALVLGLITWIGLLAIATLMCAELNAALIWRRDDSLSAVQDA